MDTYNYFLLDEDKVVASFFTREEVWDVINSLGLTPEQYIYIKGEDSWYFTGDSRLSIMNYDYLMKLAEMIENN